MLLGDDSSGEALVSSTLMSLGHLSWKQYVHDGFVKGTALPAAQVSVGTLPGFQLSPGQQAGSKRGGSLGKRAEGLAHARADAASHAA